MTASRVTHSLGKEQKRREMVVLTHVLRWGSWLIEGPDLGVPNGPLNVLSDRL